MAESVTTRRPWSEVVEAKRSVQDEKIKQYGNTKSLAEDDIARVTAIDSVDELTRLIATGNLTAAKVTGAYITK